MVRTRLTRGAEPCVERPGPGSEVVYVLFQGVMRQELLQGCVAVCAHTAFRELQGNKARPGLEIVSPPTAARHRLACRRHTQGGGCEPVMRNQNKHDAVGQARPPVACFAMASCRPLEHDACRLGLRGASCHGDIPCDIQHLHAWQEHPTTPSCHWLPSPRPLRNNNTHFASGARHGRSHADLGFARTHARTCSFHTYCVRARPPTKTHTRCTQGTMGTPAARKPAT